MKALTIAAVRVTLTQVRKSRDSAKRADGRVHDQGKVAANRRSLGAWVRSIGEPWSEAMIATLFTGWIQDFLSLGPYNITTASSPTLGWSRPSRHPSESPGHNTTARRKGSPIPGPSRLAYAQSHSAGFPECRRYGESLTCL